MRFGRRDVSLVELDGRTRKCTFGFAAFALHPFHRAVRREHHGRIIAGFQTSLYIRLFFRVGGAHRIGGGLGGFECVGDSESDVLAVIADHVILKWGTALFADTIKSRRGSGAEDLANVPAM